MMYSLPATYRLNSPAKQRRRPFTLLEVLIAMALVTVILTAVGYYFLQMKYIDTRLERLQNEIYQQSYVQNRLARVIPKALNENNSSKEFFFFSSRDGAGDLFLPGTQSLVFTYDNGINLDKPFSNNVLGRLFVDDAGRLTLATWPLPKRWKDEGSPPVKKEVLLENVTGLSFEFFLPSDVNRSKVTTPASQVEKRRLRNPEAYNRWYQSWSMDYYMLPSIVKINLKRMNIENE